MKDFDWTSYTKKIAISAPLSDVYDAWSIPTRIESWFLERAEFLDTDKRPLAGDQRIAGGSVYRWYWHLYPEPMIGEIKQCNGQDFVQFTFERLSLVDVRLTFRDNYTWVELRHYNIPTDDHYKQFVRLGCSNGWTFYLTNLKSVLEGGLDLRNRDRRLPQMLNN